MIHWLIDNENAAPLDSNAWDSLMKHKDLGFLKLPFDDANWKHSADLGSKISEKVKCLVVIGMGGSSLGGRLLCEFKKVTGRTVVFLSNSDPQQIVKLQSALASFSNTEIGYLIISKSGGTLEVSALISALAVTSDAYFVNNKNKWVITENKKSPLYDWAQKHNITCIDHPKDLGGRFSIFSPVGLVPAAFLGLDLMALQKGAQKAFESKDALLNFVHWSFDNFLDGKRISVFWSYSEKLDVFLPWLQQLWAESLGKKENLLASMPHLSFGATDQHSVLQQYLESENDKNFIFFRERDLASQGPKLSSEMSLGDKNINGIRLGELIMAQSYGTQKALQAESYECAAIELDFADEAHLGELIMSFELIIGLLGEVLEINAYDQPSVEKGKKITSSLLAELQGRHQ